MCWSLFFLLSSQLHAKEDRAELSRFCQFVTYQPTALSGCGFLLDFTSIESTELLSFTEKHQLLEAMQRSSPDSAIKILSSHPETSKFVQLVTVSVNLAQTGAVVGQTLDCHVTSPSGKPVAAGYLLPTKMGTNDPSDSQKYGTAGGFVIAGDSSVPGSKILSGCRILVDLTQSITKENELVLSIDNRHASAQVASDISHTLRTHFQTNAHDVTALDSRHIKIHLPKQYKGHAFEFAAEILELPMYLSPQLQIPQTATRVKQEQPH